MTEVFGRGKGFGQYTEKDEQYFSDSMKVHLPSYKGYLTQLGGLTSELGDVFGLLGARHGSPDNARMAEMLTPDQLRAEYGFTEKINRDMSRQEAEWIREEALEESAKTATMARLDPNNPIRNTAYPFLGAMTDPVGIGIGVIAAMSGVGLLGVGARAAQLAKMSRAANALRTAAQWGSGASTSVGGRMAVGALLEGPLETLIEVPVMKWKEEELGREYGIREGLYALGGNMAGNALFEGLRGVWGKLRLKEGQLKTAVDMKMNEIDMQKRPPQIDYAGRSLQLEYHTNKYGMVPYKYKRVGAPEFKNPKVVRVQEGTFYSAHNGAKGLFDAKTQVAIDGTYGKGLLLTDNQNIARNAVARKSDLSNGEVLTVRTGELEMLDIDKGIDTDMESGVRTILESFLGKEYADEMLSRNTTMKEVLDEVDKIANQEQLWKMQEDINTYAKESGYDGYKWEGGTIIGDKSVTPEYRHNSMYLFDADKTTVTEMNKYDSQMWGDEEGLGSVVNELESYKNYLNTAESELNYVKDWDTEWKEIPKEPKVYDPKTETARIKAEMEELKAEFKDLETRKIDKGGEKLSKTEDIITPEKAREATKAAAFCVRNS